jgi:Zn-dependent peptidase ImmA (M78 family)
MNNNPQNLTSVQKGDDLESSFYGYLSKQINEDHLVYGIYPAKLCKLYRKKKYPCKERSRPIEVDIALEIYREGAKTPHIIVIFECKNYRGNLPETVVTDFSDKLGRIAKHGAKGILVSSSQLQQGAFDLAKARHLGVCKFDKNGLDVILERTGNIINQKTLLAEITHQSTYQKGLKFSAFLDGKYYDSLGYFLASLTSQKRPINQVSEGRIPFLDYEVIEDRAQSLLKNIGYTNGIVNLEDICQQLKIQLISSEEELYDSYDNQILGQADFQQREISIFNHEHIGRMRFTIAHEIGHFALQHNDFIKCESVVENDLVIQEDQKSPLERLEFQANYFASCLLLPKDSFLKATAFFREKHDIRDKTFGYIYVDDQYCNRSSYRTLLQELALEFGASETSVEIRLKKLVPVTDLRDPRNSESFIARYFRR